MTIARADRPVIVIIIALVLCGLTVPQARAAVTVELGDVRAAAHQFVQEKFGVSDRAAMGIMKHYEMLNGSKVIDRLELPEGALLDFVKVDGDAAPGEPMVTYEGSGILHKTRPLLLYEVLQEGLDQLPPKQRARLQRNIAEAARRGFFIQPLTADQRRNLESYRLPGEPAEKGKGPQIIRIFVVLNNFPHWDDRSPSQSTYDNHGDDRNHPIATPSGGTPGGPLSAGQPTGLSNPAWSHTGVTADTASGHPRIEYTLDGRQGTSVDLKEYWFNFLFNHNNPLSLTNYYYANSHANVSIEGNRSDVAGPLESHHKLDRKPYGEDWSAPDYAIQPGTPVIRSVGGSGFRAMSGDSGTKTISLLFHGAAPSSGFSAETWDAAATPPAFIDAAVQSTTVDKYDNRRVTLTCTTLNANEPFRVTHGSMGTRQATCDAGYSLSNTTLTTGDVMGSDAGNRLCSMCYYTHDHIFTDSKASRAYQLAHLRNSSGKTDDIGGTVDDVRDHEDRPKPYDHDVIDHDAPNYGYFESPESNGGHGGGNWLADLGLVLQDEGIVLTGYSRGIYLYPSDTAGGIDAGGTSGPWSGAHVFIPNSSVVLPSNAGLYLTAHEVGHTFGMADVYDCDMYRNRSGFEPPLFECSMMGPYSVMAHDGYRVDAWHKIKLGWVTPIAVTEDIVAAQVLEIEGTLENPVIYKLPGRPHYIHNGVNPAYWTEYFLVENRNRTGADYFGDKSPRGLYIYHVDQRFGQYEEWHPMLIIEQADGLYELERYPDGYCRTPTPLPNDKMRGDPFPGLLDVRNWTQLTDPNSYSHGWKGGTINSLVPKTEPPAPPPPGVLQPGTSTDSFSRVANISDAGATMRADLHVVPREVIVTSDDCAERPATALQGAEDVPMLILHLDNDGDAPNLSMDDVEIDQIRIDESGSSQTDTDVTRVSLWDDTDGDGHFDAAQDTRIATGVFDQQTAVMSGLDYRIPLEETRDMFITYDVNEKARSSAGQSLGVGLAEFDYIIPEVPGAVQRRERTAMTASSSGLGAYRFPITSELVPIEEAPDTLTVTPISRAPVDTAGTSAKAINPGDTDVPILSLDLAVDMDSVEIDRVMVDETGTIDAVARITSAKLYLDVNSDGQVGGADQLLEETTFSSVGGTERATFDIHDNSVTVTDVNPRSLLMTCSLSPDTPLPCSLQLRLEDPTYIHLVDAIDIVSDENFPIESELVATPEPNLPPAAPQNLTATAQDDGTILLEWGLSDDDPNKQEDDVTEYHIYRASDPADFVGMTVYYAAVAAGETQFVDDNLPLGVDMYYMVRAYDGVQEGPDSNIVGPVQGHDGLAPTFSEFEPAKDEVGVRRDTNIAFTIEDTGSGIDQSTLVFEVDGTDVAGDAETTIIGSTARLQVAYDPPEDFDYLQTVEVSLQVADSAGNVAPAAGEFESYEFTTVGPPTHSISGIVLDGDDNPEAGVTVTADTTSAVTGADGTYEIAGLVEGTYEVLPTKEGMSFAPESRSVTLPPSALGVNFTAVPGYDMSGEVRLADTGDPLAGVQVSDGVHTDITDNDGQWTFNDVPAGTYTVAATLAGYAFDPPSIEVTLGLPQGDVTGLLFEASVQTFDITGTVTTTVGERLAGIQVDASQNGTVVASATTNASGGYTLAGLAPGTYTVRPTDEDYAFEPAQRQIDLAADESNVDFTAAALYSMTIPAGVNLLGVPVRPLDDDVVAAFGANAGIARWDPTNSPPYLVAPSADPLMALVPGRGFWVTVANQVVREIAGELVGNSEDIIVSLQTGWNMAANPYDRDLAWAQVKVPAGSPASNYGFTYDSAAGTYRLVTTTAGLGAVTTVSKNAGFWMRSGADTQVTIEGPGTATAAVEQEAAGARQPASGSWVIPIVARAAGVMDASSYAGVLPGAAANPAAYKIDNPPAVSPYVDAYFTTGTGRRLAVDIRAQAASVESWEFVVTTDIAGVEIEVTLADLSEVPADKKVTLVDVDAGKRIYARTMPAYSYNSGEGGSRHFRVEVSEDVGGGLAITSAAASGTAAGQVAISYTLSAEAEVSLQVLNIAGRPVAVVATSQAKGAGVNSTVWNGRSKSGTVCPAGQYLVRISAVASDGQRVQALVPVSIER